MKVSNPLGFASQQFVVNIINTLSGLTLTGNPVVGRVRTLRAFSIGMVDFGPNSCIKVNYGDGSATEVYGPDRFVSFILLQSFESSVKYHKL